LTFKVGFSGSLHVSWQAHWKAPATGSESLSVTQQEHIQHQESSTDCRFHFFLLYLVVHRTRTTSEVLAKILGDGLRMAVELKPQQSRNPDMMQTSADLVTDPYSQESTYRGPLWQHDD